MLQTILAYLWERRTTALGYVVTTLGIMATSDLFTSRQVKWFLLINGILTAILGHYNNRQLLPSSPGSSQGGFVRPLMLASLLATMIVVLLSACAPNAVKSAENFEQKSWALYGTYVVFQGRAASMVQDPVIPERVKQALRDADKIAYPVSESLVDSALTVWDIREILRACETQESIDPEKCEVTNEQTLNNAIQNLSKIYFMAQPKLLAVVSAVKGAK